MLAGKRTGQHHQVCLCVCEEMKPTHIVRHLKNRENFRHYPNATVRSETKPIFIAHITQHVGELLQTI